MPHLMNRHINGLEKNANTPPPGNPSSHGQRTRLRDVVPRPLLTFRSYPFLPIHDETV